MTPPRIFVNALFALEGTPLQSQYLLKMQVLIKRNHGGAPILVLKEKRKRKGQQKCDCKFHLYGRVKKDSWHLIVINGELNQPLTLDIADHAAARRQTNNKRSLWS